MHERPASGAVRRRARAPGAEARKAADWRSLSPATRLYAVLGHPIAHSLSPPMQNAAFAALGLDAVYLAFDVPPARLLRVLPVLADLGFRGVNLTVPLKEIAARGLARLDDTARLLGSVNTVCATSRGLTGHSTDGDGFLRAVREAFGLTPCGRNVFLLGCGGAGRAVAMACARAGARVLGLADADRGRVRRLASDLRAAYPDVAVAAAGQDRRAWSHACRAASLVVQATPVGMHAGDPALLEPESFHAGQCVFDLIYMAPETPFLRAAAAGGARIANGLGMLLHQGALSLALWTGRTPPLAVMRRVLEARVYGRAEPAPTRR